MSDSETDSVSGASFKSRSSISSSSGSMISDLPVLSACQKKKQGLEAISTLDNTIADHRIILENEKRTGRPELVLQIQNSIETFLEVRKKMVSELRTMPPCLDPNCTDHTILKTKDSVSDLSNVNDKKQSNKRKIKKQDLEGFAFPKKTVRPTTPTQVLQPIPTQNNFEMLNQNPEPMEEAAVEKAPPALRNPLPITLKTGLNLATPNTSTAVLFWRVEVRPCLIHGDKLSDKVGGIPNESAQKLLGKLRICYWSAFSKYGTHLAQRFCIPNSLYKMIPVLSSDKPIDSSILSPLYHSLFLQYYSMLVFDSFKSVWGFLAVFHVSYLRGTSDEV
ncbi:hypothetical protein TNIN_22711 [Trichonephila inaurata madagascariensis]|uniref:Uncharacterized protein n=1 Tax=Trichonephila inaurata madagascariensis TaxID=2747483 RepID=A0A8X6YJ56_9ARAC|nr:hypothetical protein TNIN_22711 [Trichonephila inaurata madagascariensis]